MIKRVKQLILDKKSVLVIAKDVDSALVLSEEFKKQGVRHGLLGLPIGEVIKYRCQIAPASFVESIDWSFDVIIDQEKTALRGRSIYQDTLSNVLSVNCRCIPWSLESREEEKNMKLKAVPDVIKESCEGCIFNINPKMNICATQIQIINGRKYSCGSDKIIYQEEKNMNKMPELKAGMVIKLSDSASEPILLLISSDWGINLVNGLRLNFSPSEIIKVYSITRPVDFSNIKFNLKIAWSKKSSELESLEKAYEELGQKIKEMKCQ